MFRRFGSLCGKDLTIVLQVVLVWSVKSGKARLYWNNQDISHLFPDMTHQKTPLTSLEFSWQSSKGTHFRIHTHTNPVASGDQYNFVVDKKAFADLPTRDAAVLERIELVRAELVSCGSDDVLGSRVERCLSADFPGSCGEQSGELPNQSRMENRLAAAGFSYRFDMEDELTSHMSSKVYSSTLDVLRDETGSLVPDAEEMMSRAIINTFSEDPDSDTSNESASDRSHYEPSDVEADIYGDAVEWLRWARDFISVFDMPDRKLEFMQKQVELIVSHVRHDRISAKVATTVLHRVAVMLNLHVTQHPAPNTLVFLNLNSLTTTKDIMDAMHVYGDVISAAVSRNHEGFGQLKNLMILIKCSEYCTPLTRCCFIGFCRFASDNSAMRVSEGAAKGLVQINGRRPEVFDLLQLPFSKEIEAKIVECREKDLDYDCYDDCDIIDPSDDAIEATYNNLHRGSLLTQISSSKSSSSSYNFQHPSMKSASHGTVATISTLDVTEDLNSFVPMPVLDQILH
jgi:hypothetical protein